MAGFDNNVMYADNVDFSGSVNPAPQITTDAQLLIGSTAAPNIRPGVLTSPDGSIDFGYSAPNITGQIATGSAVVKTITGNTGTAATPTLGNINVVGAGSLTAVSGASTDTISLTGLTNHNLLIGAGTDTITKVAPSATSGVPVVSQGAAADPAFGTATVPGGGTGLTSLSTYQLLAGGTTSTGNVQQVASTGSAGQVLMSNGAGALPTWSTNPPAVFQPNSVIQLYDDFISCIATGSFSSQLFWLVNGTNMASLASVDTTHVGILNCPVSNLTGASQATISLKGANATGAFILGGGVITLNWVVKIATLSTVTNTYITRFGIAGPSAVSEWTDGVYFEYSNGINSGNWNFKTANASSRTTRNSSIAADTNWHNFQIVIDATASTCSAFIDGVSVGASIAADIPTIVLSPSFQMLWQLGTVAIGSNQIDLMYLTKVLTTPR